MLRFSHFLSKFQAFYRPWKIDGGNPVLSLLNINSFQFMQVDRYTCIYKYICQTYLDHPITNEWSIEHHDVTVLYISLFSSKSSIYFGRYIHRTKFLSNILDRPKIKTVKDCTISLRYFFCTTPRSKKWPSMPICKLWTINSKDRWFPIEIPTFLDVHRAVWSPYLTKSGRAHLHEDVHW